MRSQPIIFVIVLFVLLIGVLSMVTLRPATLIGGSTTTQELYASEHDFFFGEQVAKITTNGVESALTIYQQPESYLYGEVHYLENNQWTSKSLPDTPTDSEWIRLDEEKTYSLPETTHALVYLCRLYDLSELIDLTFTGQEWEVILAEFSGQQQKYFCGASAILLGTQQIDDNNWHLIASSCTDDRTDQEICAENTCGTVDDQCGIERLCGTCDTGTCINNQCVDTCQNECDPYGSKQCGEEQCYEGFCTITYQNCGDYDSDNCYEWSEPIACGPGETCDMGICLPEASVCGDGIITGVENCDIGDLSFTADSFGSNSYSTNLEQTTPGTFIGAINEGSSRQFTIHIDLPRLELTLEDSSGAEQILPLAKSGRLYRAVDGFVTYDFIGPEMGSAVCSFAGGSGTLLCTNNCQLDYSYCGTFE